MDEVMEVYSNSFNSFMDREVKVNRMIPITSSPMVSTGITVKSYNKVRNINPRVIKRVNMQKPLHPDSAKLVPHNVTKLKSLSLSYSIYPHSIEKNLVTIVCADYCFIASLKVIRKSDSGYIEKNLRSSNLDEKILYGTTHILYIENHMTSLVMNYIKFLYPLKPTLTLFEYYSIIEIAEDLYDFSTYSILKNYVIRNLGEANLQLYYKIFLEDEFLPGLEYIHLLFDSHMRRKIKRDPFFEDKTLNECLVEVVKYKNNVSPNTPP